VATPTPLTTQPLVGGGGTLSGGEAQSTTVNEDPIPPDSLNISSNSSAITPISHTDQPREDSEGASTPPSKGDLHTGDLITVNEDSAPPDSLATSEEANPVPTRPIRIRVIGPRPPPGYSSSGSEENVERMVLQDMEI
jgi:hypothetical protein